jgi:hypothetical protein
MAAVDEIKKTYQRKAVGGSQDAIGKDRTTPFAYCPILSN